MAINSVLKRLLGLNDTVNLSKHLFVNHQDFSSMIDQGLHISDSKLIKFKNYNSQDSASEVHLCLTRASRINLLNNDAHIVLIFHNEAMDIPGSKPFLVNSATKSNDTFSPDTIKSVGKSTAWKKVNSQLIRVAPYASNVLLQGESGTGKEVVARTLHQLSNRKGPFVAINCGAYPKDLLYSELFGYKSGAFTGATKDGLTGKFEYANGGTLFLDEIGELPIDLQSSLLRVLEERTVIRFGSNKEIRFDNLFIAASNKNIRELVRQGAFREDLYYRLNIIEIWLPPLRERKSDITLLANYFALEFSKRFSWNQVVICDDALQILYNYDWPGNVRELRNIIERALILTGSNIITVDALPPYLLQHTSQNALESTIIDTTIANEGELISETLMRNKGNIAKTAAALNLSRVTLYKKIEKYNISLNTCRLNSNCQEKND